MTWIDILILLPLLIGLVRGLMRGLVVELTAIVGIVLGFVGARLWGAHFALWLMRQFAWSEAVCSVVAYSLLFVGIALFLNIVARLLSRLFKAISLGWLNRLLGAVFGVAKWAIVVLLIVLCVHRLDEQFHFFRDDLKEQSVIYNYTTPLAEKAWQQVQTEVMSQDIGLEIGDKKGTKKEDAL